MSRSRVVRSSSNVNLWRTPLLLSLASVALFGLTMIPDVLDAYGVIHLPFWLTMGSIDDARAILSAMLGSVSTVLALIFSVALLVLSMVATLFGPRLLYRFIQDWVTQVTIGFFMGTFVYLCLCFLVTHQDATRGSSRRSRSSRAGCSWSRASGSSSSTATGSRPRSRTRTSSRASSTISCPRSSKSHATATRRGDAPRPRRSKRRSPRARRSRARRADTSRTSITTRSFGGERAGAVVHVLRRPGQFVLRGEPLASRLARRSSGRARRFDRSTRPDRSTPHADPGRRVRRRADRRDRPPRAEPRGQRHLHGRRVRRLARRRACVLGRTRPARRHAGTTRPASCACTCDRFGSSVSRKMAFDQIRQAVADNPAVLIRILDTIGASRRGCTRSSAASSRPTPTRFARPRPPRSSSSWVAMTSRRLGIEHALRWNLHRPRRRPHRARRARGQCGGAHRDCVSRGDERRAWGGVDSHLGWAARRHLGSPRALAATESSA